MELRKITYGFVVQRFDSNTQECLGQEFVAGDQVEYETESGDWVEDSDFNSMDHDFEMINPQDVYARVSVEDINKLIQLLNDVREKYGDCDVMAEVGNDNAICASCTSDAEFSPWGIAFDEENKIVYVSLNVVEYDEDEDEDED